MKTKDQIESIHQKALGTLDSDRKSLERLLTEYSDFPIIPFIHRVLDWRCDKNKSQWLWEFAHQAFDLSPLLFLGGFTSFVSNCLLDDSSFKIDWRKPELNGHQLIWLPGGEFKTMLTTKEDPDSRPLLLWAGDDGTSNVDILMEAMDLLEQRELERLRKAQELE